MSGFSDPDYARYPMTLTDEQLAELRKVAEAATPGPWQELHNMAGPMGVICHMPEGFGEKVCWLDINAREHANAAYIAALNPATIIALLDELSQLRAQAAWRPDREEIEKAARIIDPWAFKQCEWAIAQGRDDLLKAHLPDRERAIAKATAILSLPNPRKDNKA